MKPPQIKRAQSEPAIGLTLVGIALILSVAAAWRPDLRGIAVTVIFVGSYAALAIGRIPGLSIDRAGIALAGAGLTITAGALPLDEAYRAIDLDTLALLLGMMIIAASLRLSGFFAFASRWIADHAGTPTILLVGVVATSGLFSAFLVNDAVCLVLAPLVLGLTRAMGRNPVPYLLAVAMASNVGSAATITGNPQNIMIGSLSRIPYASFAGALCPAALAGLVVSAAAIWLLHPGEFAGHVQLTPATAESRVNRVLVIRALVATAAVIMLFFAGMAPAKAAIIIAGLLLLTRRLKSRRIYAEIDWTLLLMFAGLFVIVAGAERTLLTPAIIADVGRLDLDRVPILTGVTAVLSNLVSNVPAVLVIKPFVGALADPDRAWLVISMAATFAGNFTVLGSIANLIVVQKAAEGGVVIDFWAYFRVGAPLTVITLVIGALWL